MAVNYLVKLLSEWFRQSLPLSGEVARRKP